jgi:hypothetical protein
VAYSLQTRQLIELLQDESAIALLSTPFNLSTIYSRILKVAKESLRLRDTGSLPDSDVSGVLNLLQFAQATDSFRPMKATLTLLYDAFSQPRERGLCQSKVDEMYEQSRLSLLNESSLVNQESDTSNNRESY